MALNFGPYSRLIREELGKYDTHLRHIHDRLNFVVGVCESMVQGLASLHFERRKLEEMRKARDRRFKKNAKPKRKKRK